MPLSLSICSRGNRPLERSEKENANSSEKKEGRSDSVQEFRVYPSLSFSLAMLVFLL